MHRLLYIDELVRCIVSHCLKASTVALSQTCKLINEIATDSLWAHMSSLEPLVRLIPPVSLGKRKHGLEEFARYKSRLQHYARRVCILHISEMSGDKPRMSTILSIYPDLTIHQLLPRLKRIYIRVYTAACATDAVRFAVPTVSAVHLTIVPGNMPGSLALETMPVPFPIPLGPHFTQLLAMSTVEVDPDCPSRFCQALKTLPRLDYLYLYARHNSDGCTHELLSFVEKGFPSIKDITLDVDPLSNYALSVITTLSRLERLNIAMETVVEMPSEWHMPHLVTLELSDRCLSGTSDLLARLCAPRLRTIQVTAYSSSVCFPNGPSGRYRQLTQIIATTWPDLHYFTLRGSLSMDDEKKQHMWSFDPFRPLLACGSLARLNVQTDHRVCITDADLQDISVAWPHLESLMLESAFVPFPIPTYVSKLPSATFKGLLALARNCSKLTNLGLSLTFTEPGQSMSSLAPEFTSLAPLAELSAQDFPPYNVAFASDMLVKLFPNLRRISCFEMNRVAAERDPYYESTELKRLSCMSKMRARLGVVALKPYGCLCRNCSDFEGEDESGDDSEEEYEDGSDQWSDVGGEEGSNEGSGEEADGEAGDDSEEWTDEDTDVGVDSVANVA